MSSIARVFAPRSVTILVVRGVDGLDETSGYELEKHTSSRVRNTSHTAQGHVRRPRAQWDLVMIAKVL
jgi:hypothetical protein